MDAHKPRSKKGPEAIIQEQIIAYLRARSWHVMPTHGNLYQSGFPDLYAFHTMYRARWIECKNPLSYKFQISQLENFPKMGFVWILVAANAHEYAKLFGPPNWHTYLRH